MCTRRAPLLPELGSPPSLHEHWCSTDLDSKVWSSLGPCLWQTPAWLEQMIAHTTWRDLFYKLAEAHPDCLMLNFTVKVGRTLESRKDEKQVSSVVLSGACSECEGQH